MSGQLQFSVFIELYNLQVKKVCEKFKKIGKMFNKLLKIVFFLRILMTCIDSLPLTIPTNSTAILANGTSADLLADFNETNRTTLFDAETNLTIDPNESIVNKTRPRRCIGCLLSNLLFDFELKIHKKPAPVVTQAPKVHGFNLDFYHYHNHGPIQTPGLIKETYIGIGHNGFVPAVVTEDWDEQKELDEVNRMEAQIKDDADDDDDEEDVDVDVDENGGEVEETKGEEGNGKVFKFGLQSKLFVSHRHKLAKLKKKILSISNGAKRKHLLHELNLSLKRLIKLKKDSKRKTSTKVSSTKIVKKITRKNMKKKKTVNQKNQKTSKN